MCGRYTLRQADQLPLRFAADATPEVHAALGARFNIAPTQTVPIVTEARAGARAIELAAWGLTPHRTGGKSFLAFNARAETLTERPLFRGLLPRSRCLIPGDGFIEWEKEGKARNPFFFGLEDGAIFAFAGLLDRWIDADGHGHAACTIITTAPNGTVGRVHDRMPVILPPDAEAEWLDPTTKDVGALLPLLSPYAAPMATWPLDRAINSSKVDDPHLIEARA